MNINDCLRRAKVALIMNSTTDFKLLMQTNLPREEQDAAFLEEANNEKSRFIAEELKHVNNLIVYTYDQNVEISNDNILY
jgi:hypothetical protein